MKRHAEVLIVGAGPAGMAAAIAAASCGCRVLVLDENPAAGGQIWRAATAVNKHERQSRERERISTAFANSGAELLSGCRVIDAPAPHTLRAAHDGGGITSVETLTWDKLILATGARERFLPFPGWTLPGVFGAGGLQALAKNGLPVAGKRIVVAGTGPLLVAVAAHLQQYGALVACIVEQASWKQTLPFALSLWKQPRKLLQGLGYRLQLSDVPYHTGFWPVAAHGDTQLQSITLTNGTDTWTEPCDFLACGFHLVPNTELATLLGCKLEAGFVTVGAHQQTSIEGIFCAGEPTRIGGLGSALVEGEIAGFAAANASKLPRDLFQQREQERAFAARLAEAFRLREELRGLSSSETVVCRCEDVSFAELEHRQSWTEAKLQTRCGMGPCQGRICGPAAEALFGWRVTSVRPPLFPIPIAAFCDDNTQSQEALAG